ncbi:MAG: 50S ribosomal protein L15 [Nitrospirae bacterium]|nr:MAG: 50S ribosomal protein L15 [Nitrospirota bacterium]
MRIDELAPAKGSKKRPKRVGRGPGSGHGKTSCKGHKGQKSRSGTSIPAGFEGGQMPLHRRLPKRGFSNHPFKREFAIVNLKRLEGLNAEEITPELLLKEGVISSLKDGLKVLGDGEIKRAVTVKAHAFSKSAIQKIEAAGGRAEVI